MLTYKIFIALVLLVNTARLSDASHESVADSAQKATDEDREKEFSKHLENMSAEQKDHCKMIKLFIESGEYKISKNNLEKGIISVKPCSMIENEFKFTPHWTFPKLINNYMDGVRIFVENLTTQKGYNNWEKYLGIHKYCGTKSSKTAHEGSTSKLRVVSNTLQSTEATNPQVEHSYQKTTSSGDDQLENDEETSATDEMFDLMSNLKVLVSRNQGHAVEPVASTNGHDDFATMLTAIAAVDITGDCGYKINLFRQFYDNTQFVSSWDDWETLPKSKRYQEKIHSMVAEDNMITQLLNGNNHINPNIYAFRWEADEILWNMGSKCIPLDQFESFMHTQARLLEDACSYHGMYRAGTIFTEYYNENWRADRRKLLDGNVLSFLMDAWGERGTNTKLCDYLSSWQYFILLNDVGKVLKFYTDRHTFTDFQWATAFSSIDRNKTFDDRFSRHGGYLSIIISGEIGLDASIKVYLVANESKGAASKIDLVKKLIIDISIEKHQIPGSDELSHKVLCYMKKKLSKAAGGVITLSESSSTGNSGKLSFDFVMAHLAQRYLSNTEHPFYIENDDYNKIVTRYDFFNMFQWYGHRVSARFRKECLRRCTHRSSVCLKRPCQCSYGQISEQSENPRDNVISSEGSSYPRSDQMEVFGTAAACSGKPIDYVIIKQGIQSLLR